MKDLDVTLVGKSMLPQTQSKVMNKINRMRHHGLHPINRYKASLLNSFTEKQFCA